MLYPDLKSYIQTIEGKISAIPESRKEQLQQIADYISAKRGFKESVKLNFICTHNSRRSHLCQIWSAVLAEYVVLDDIETYSGGTEATAFNSRAVAAVKRAGFKVKDPQGENTTYKVYYDDEKEPLICFSKTFEDSYNPQENFAAVMTCADADENCPIIPGAEKRFSIPYVDPKESDDTPREREIYDERCRQIATEMYYLMLRAKKPKN